MGSTTEAVDPTTIALIALAMLYVPIVGVALKRRNAREWPAGLLISYAAISSLWTLGQALLRMGRFSALAEDVPARVVLYGLILLSCLLLQLNRSFLRLAGIGWGWWALGGAWIAAVVVLNENLLGLPELSWARSLPGVPYQVLSLGAFALGWGGLMVGAVWLTARAHRRAQQPLHRNRIKYWALALGLTIAGDALLFAAGTPWGSGLHLLGACGAAYAILTYHLPDMRQMVRRAASFLAITLLTVVIYTAGFLAAQALFQSVPGYSPLLAGATMALVLALLFQPLLGLAQQLVSRLISGTPYDPGHTLREYSKHVGNILDLERLATVMVDLIGEAMGARHGILFVVHSEKGTHNGGNGHHYFRLRDVSGTGKDSPPGVLAVHSPVAEFLRQEHRPLTQYDVDLLPRFRENSPAEQAWLASLDVDVYVPIYAKGEWIGLLALGPKASGDRYFDDDLALLSTLADQTAVALQNARLFDNLKMRNAENEQLNQELAAANREMARLDKAKSDFIDIASHELRTPLTQVRGYNEILGDMIEEGSLTLDTGLQMIHGVAKGVQRLEEIVDLMFDVSQLDTETLVLEMSETPLSLIIRKAVDTWARALEERGQTLTVENLENLPPIRADGKRLRQVFSHLVQNAVKYTPDGGHIRIVGRLLSKEMPPQDQAVEIVVADTGIGIATDDLKRIFDKFYRAGDINSHSTGRTKFKGAGPGLGLTIARGIVEAHGGRIWAESPGCDEQLCPGSQFHVVLPLQPQLLESAGLEAFIDAIRAQADHIP